MLIVEVSMVKVVLEDIMNFCWVGLDSMLAGVYWLNGGII